MSLERVLIATALLVAGVLGAFHFGVLKFPEKHSGFMFSTNIGEVVSHLKQNQKADIFSSLDSGSQELLVNLVREHCSRKYEEQSCLHYAISCGRPCMAYLTKPERVRLLDSYERLSSRKVGGL
jgi:hypothetical protein